MFEAAGEVCGGQFTLHATPERMLWVTMCGQGSVEGTRALIAAAGELLARHGEGRPFRVTVDMASFKGGPLRAQIIAGRWLLKAREHFTPIAIVGGGPWEVRLARTVVRIAGLRNVEFFASLSELIFAKNISSVSVLGAPMETQI